MNTHQPMLLNTSLMASTKQMNAVRRARTLATTTSTVSQCSASAYSNSATPKGSPEKWRDGESEPEFNMPDESRKLAENVWPRCSSCGAKGILHRIAAYSFQITCPCPYHGPIFHSSQRAINHWKLVQKILSRNL